MHSDILILINVLIAKNLLVIQFIIAIFTALLYKYQTQNINDVLPRFQTLKYPLTNFIVYVQLAFIFWTFAFMGFCSYLHIHIVSWF